MSRKGNCLDKCDYGTTPTHILERDRQRHAFQVCFIQCRWGGKHAHGTACMSTALFSRHTPMSFGSQSELERAPKHRHAETHMQT